MPHIITISHYKKIRMFYSCICITCRHRQRPSTPFCDHMPRSRLGTVASDFGNWETTLLGHTFIRDVKLYTRYPLDHHSPFVKSDNLPHAHCNSVFHFFRPFVSLIPVFVLCLSLTNHPFLYLIVSASFICNIISRAQYIISSGTPNSRSGSPPAFPLTPTSWVFGHTLSSYTTTQHTRFRFSCHFCQSSFHT